MTIKLTKFEEEIMRAIPQDDFYESGYESVLWTDVLLDNVKMDNKKARGVLASLSKKGLLELYSTKEKSDPSDKNCATNSTTALTDKGIEWLKANTTNLDTNGYKVHTTTNNQPQIITVNMRTFTGMNLGNYEARMNLTNKTYEVDGKKGLLTFASINELKKPQTNAKNVKFANYITIAEQQTTI